jgi:hypothetical protein
MSFHTVIYTSPIIPRQSVALGDLPPPSESKKKHPKYPDKTNPNPIEDRKYLDTPKRKTQDKTPKADNPRETNAPNKTDPVQPPSPKKKMIKIKKPRNRNSQAKTPFTQKIVRCFYPAAQ